MANTDHSPRFVVVRALPIVLLGTGLVLFFGLAVQQNYRQSANDPQIQMAEDAAAALSHGARPDNVVSATKVDKEHSLAPFMTVVNKQRQIVASNVESDTDSALPPVGVFDNVDAHGEQRLSWQTAQGVRFATVVVPASNGYVIAARSLKEVEIRENNLKILDIVALVGVLAVAILTVVVIR